MRCASLRLGWLVTSRRFSRSAIRLTPRAGRWRLLVRKPSRSQDEVRVRAPRPGRVEALDREAGALYGCGELGGFAFVRLLAGDDVLVGLFDAVLPARGRRDLLDQERAAGLEGAGQFGKQRRMV